MKWWILYARPGEVWYQCGTHSMSRPICEAWH